MIIIKENTQNEAFYHKNTPLKIGILKVYDQIFPFFYEIPLSHFFSYHSITKFNFVNFDISIRNNLVLIKKKICN